MKRALSLLLSALLAGPQTAFAQTVFRPELGAPSVRFAAVVVSVRPGQLPLSLALPALTRPSLPTVKAPAVRADAVRLAAPQAPDVPAASAKAELDSRWEGKVQAGTVSVPEGRASLPALAAPAAPAAVPERPVPAPKVLLARTGIIAGWLGLAGLAGLTHAPFDRVAPLVISVLMSAAFSFMLMVMVGSMQTAVAEPAAPPTGPPADEPEVRARLTALAKTVGLPAPARFKLVESDVVQAQAGGTPQDYEVRIYRGLLSLPLDQQEAVMRHELGHVKHQDSVFTGVNMLLAPLAPSIALLSGVISDPRGWWTVPFAAAALAAWGAVKKLDEFHADQFAAHTQGAARPFVRFFREDIIRRDEEEAARPKPANVFGRAWRRAQSIWEKISTVTSSHPSHERRIARLERLRS